MILSVLMLALFLAAPSVTETSSPPAIRAHRPPVKYRIEIAKSRNGHVERAVLQNADGTKMTNCPTYLALVIFVPSAFWSTARSTCRSEEHTSELQSHHDLVC